MLASDVITASDSIMNIQHAATVGPTGWTFDIYSSRSTCDLQATVDLTVRI